MKKITLLSLLLPGRSIMLDAPVPAIEWQYMQDDADNMDGILFSHAVRFDALPDSTNHY